MSGVCSRFIYRGGGVEKGKREFSKQRSNSRSGESVRSTQEDTVIISKITLYTISVE